MKKISFILLVCMFATVFSSFSAFGEEYYEMSPVDIRYTSFNAYTIPDDELTYTSEYVDYKVMNFPSEYEKSLNINTAPGGSFSARLDFEKTDFKNLILETSVCYKGKLNSKKEIFVLSDGENSVSFLNMDEKGQVCDFNGNKVSLVKKATFYRYSLLLDFENGTYKVVVNDLTRSSGKIPEELTGVLYSDFIIKDCTGNEENFYVKYFRAYEGTKLTNDTFKKVPKQGDKSTFETVEKLVVTDEMVKDRIKDMIIVSAKTNRVNIKGTLGVIDSENAEIKPEYIDGIFYLPAPFAATITGSTLSQSPAGVTFSTPSKEVSFKVGVSEITVNGKKNSTIGSAFYKNDIVYVPSVEFCNAFLMTSDTVNITSITVISPKGEEFNFDVHSDIKIFNKAVRNVVYENPTTEEIVATFEARTNRNHPRLLFDEDRLVVLRERIKVEPWKSWFEHVKSIADNYSNFDNLPVLEYKTSDGIRMTWIGRDAESVFVSAGIMYQLTGEDKYGDACVEMLMRLCDREVLPDWHPYHFLDVAHAALAAGYGFDWCYDRLTEEQKAIVVRCIYDYALVTVMEDYLDLPRVRTWEWSDPESSAYPQNWSEICPTQIMVAALAICDEPSLEDKNIIGDVIREGLERLRDVHETFAPDGVYIDGVEYWVSAHSATTIGLETMINVLGTDYDTLDGVGFEPTFDWIAKLTGPAGPFNYGTNSQVIASTPHHFWAANRFGRSDFTTYRLGKIEEHGFPGGWRDIIWYEPVEDSKNVTMPSEMRTRSIGNLVLRSGFEKNDTWLAAFTGEEGVDILTNQEQDGTFVLDMLGERWVVDLGREDGNYTGSLRRIKYYRNRAEGHNTVIIQPALDFNMNSAVAKKFVDMKYNDNSSFAIYDYTDSLAYKGCTSWLRGYSVDKELGNAIVQDELTASKPVEYYWFMHTQADIDIAKDGKSAVLSQNGKNILVTLKSTNPRLRFKKQAAVPLETSPKRIDPEESDNSQFSKLVVHAENVSDIKMSVEFSVLYGDTPNYVSDFTLLNDWKLKEKRYDKSLTLNSISIAGKPLENFDSSINTYEEFMGFSTILPEITATSDVGRVEVSKPSVGNSVARIRVYAKDNENRFNDYIITPKPYEYSSLAARVSTQPDLIGERPANTHRLENVKVSAAYIPQSENNPSNIVDGDFTTRYSVDIQGSYAEFDFNKVETLSHIGISNATGTRNEFFCVVVSEDGINWKLVLERGTKITGKPELQYFTFDEPIDARYVRVFHCGTSQNNETRGWWSISEIEFCAVNK